MAISVEAILADAQKLVLRLKEHDNLADCLIARTQSLQKQLDAMKQVHKYLLFYAYCLFKDLVSKYFQQDCRLLDLRLRLMRK